MSPVKPFLEQVPGVRPDSSTHDATIRTLNVVVNALTITALNYQAGTFNLSNWLGCLIVPVDQVTGSQAPHSAISSTSGAAKALKEAPPIVQPVRQEPGNQSTLACGIARLLPVASSVVLGTPCADLVSPGRLRHKHSCSRLTYRKQDSMC
jgi:hypothetical protein